MEKYITDAIHNSLRPVTGKLTRPRQKAVEELVRGLFIAGEPILAHLAQNPDVSVKKQAEKYSYHLGNINLMEQVEALALRKVSSTVRNNTVIAYDTTDINKDSAEKMEKLSGVWDGSEGTGAQGYELHGVGVNGLLLGLRLHDADTETNPQTRFSIIERVSSSLAGRGIWTLDRGNDSGSFYRDLRHTLEVRFIARVKDNRVVVLVKTGERLSVKDLPEGRHAVHILCLQTLPRKAISDAQLRLLCAIPASVFAATDPSGKAAAHPTPAVLIANPAQAGLKTGVF
jgi:hypothetical protein